MGRHCGIIVFSVTKTAFIGGCNLGERLMVQKSSAAVAILTVGSDTLPVNEEISVTGRYAKETIAKYMEVGARLELRFPDYYDARSLAPLHELHSRSAFVIDELGVRFLVAASVEEGVSRRPARPVTVVITDVFFEKPVYMKIFFNRLFPNLASVKLLPN